MKEKILRTTAALALCVCMAACAHGQTLVEAFENAPEPTPASDADPFAQAQVAIEAPLTFATNIPILEVTPMPVQESAADEVKIPESKIKDDGTIRVLLRSLGLPKELHLTLNGVYTAEHDAGFRFSDGAEVAFRNVEGEIYLSTGGLALNVGNSITLTRQADGKEEMRGLYIEESERETLYPGDLKIAVEGAGLVATMTANMEDYLQGVIAYEMSDAWPVEALKSQAVAARTYAYRRKTVAEDDYDVTDTTSDQVFKGVDSEYENVAAAVRDTEGVILTDANGNPADCWYTASNGGWIAQPDDVWDRGLSDIDYPTREDPYDLENSLSMVNSLAFSADVRESDTLRNMLQAALTEKYPEIAGVELAEVVSVEPAEELRENSRMYSKLRFTVTASTEETVEEKGLFTVREKQVRKPLDGLYIVDLTVYDQIKNGLGLGMSASDCEICTVARDGDQFIIEMRRYGHGAGMSQRGAQRMAGAYEMRWNEILAYYYPNVRPERVLWDTPVPEKIEALEDNFGMLRPAPTATPTPAPLPELREGEYYARISLGEDGSLMNLREKPTTSSQVITQFYDGTRLIVCDAEPDENGWVAVRTAEYQGYAKLNYLIKE